MSAIYITTNKINGKIYIGQTRNMRIYHRYYGSGKLLKQAIKKYGRDNFSKSTIVEGDFNQLLLDFLEIHYITLYNSTDRLKGYNLHKGGKSASRTTVGLKKPPRTEEHRKNLSKALTGNKPSAETLKRLSVSHLGYVMPEEQKRKISKSNKISMTEYKKAVLQIDFNGNIIKEYESLTEAARIMGATPGNIVKTCKGLHKSCRGFKWQYKHPQT